MTDQNALLLEIGDLFPTIGMVVPYIEIKFRLAGKYGQEQLDVTLEELVQIDKMSKFEFNNQIHYKSKDDIPITLGSGISDAGGSAGNLTDLENIVYAIAESINDPKINDLVAKYKSKN